MPWKPTETPVTEKGLKKYDHLPPAEAVMNAWYNPGDNRRHHFLMRAKVRRQMPLLARALDRMKNESGDS